MPCGSEGNRRSGVALAMRHRLQWFIQLRAHGLRQGDEHPAYTPHGVWRNFVFLNSKLCVLMRPWLAGPLTIFCVSGVTADVCVYTGSVTARMFRVPGLDLNSDEVV